MMQSAIAARAAEDPTLDSTAELEAFLAGVERSALRIARHYTGDEDEALDLVQDAMLRLARRYAGAAPEDWRALFFGILRNRLHDWHRRTRVRRRLLAWLPGGEPEEAPLESLPGPGEQQPERELESAATLAALEAALRQLPDRQREVFLLRSVDGMDIAETARAMGVSAGSVKTHYHRAVQRLRDLLGEHWHD